jgi:hypothetical protein
MSHREHLHYEGTAGPLSPSGKSAQIRQWSALSHVNNTTNHDNTVVEIERTPNWEHQEKVSLITLTSSSSHKQSLLSRRRQNVGERTNSYGSRGYNLFKDFKTVRAERACLIVLVIIFWAQTFFANVIDYDEIRGYSSTAGEVGGMEKGYETTRKSMTKKKKTTSSSSSDFVRFTTSDLNTGIISHKVRKDSGRRDSPSSITTTASPTTTSTSTRKAVDSTVVNGMPRWFTMQAKEYWTLYESNVLSCGNDMETEACALPLETYVNFAKLSINDQASILKHLGLPAIRARDLILNGISDADKQSLLLLTVDAKRGRDIIEKTATLPALKLIKRGILRSPRKVMALLAALNDNKMETSNSSSSGTQKQAHRDLLSFFPDEDVAVLFSASSAIQASIASENLSTKKLINVFEKMLAVSGNGTVVSGGARNRHQSSSSSSSSKSSAAAAKTIAMILEASRRMTAAKVLSRLDATTQALIFAKMDDTTSEALKHRVSELPKPTQAEEDSYQQQEQKGQGSVLNLVEEEALELSHINKVLKNVDVEIKTSEKEAEKERAKLEKRGDAWRGAAW